MNHKLLYWIGSAIVLVGMPLSNPIMSVGVIFLGVNWLLEGDFKTKFSKLKTNKIALACIAFFVLHLIGLFYTSDFKFALNDIKTKLPLLVLPLVFGSFHGFSRGQVKKLLFVFIGAVTLSTILSYMVYLGWLYPGKYVDDTRQISVFISHIRLGLMISFSVMILIYLLYKNNTKLKAIYVSLLFWLMGFMFVLESFTGYTTLVLGGFIVLIIYSIRLKETYLKWLCVVIAGGIAIFTGIFVKTSIDNYYDVQEDAQNLAEYSPDGEKYIHRDIDQLENGYYVHKNIAIHELIAAWDERSDIPLKGGIDAKGQFISGTIFRYLTSKGLHKDRIGVLGLSDEDVRNIENGIPNVKYVNGGFKKRIDEAIFQMDNYFTNDDPRGSSIAQRMEYWKTGVGIAANNFLIGVGTGDTKISFLSAYKANNSKLSPENRHRAHNQYLTFFISFGVIGFTAFIVMLLMPFLNGSANIDFYFLSFFVIVLLSFFWEDTLETQAGITFFCFFFSLFLIGRKREEPKSVLTHS